MFLVAFGLVAAAPRALAQVFGFSATVSTNTDLGTNYFVYTVTVTNLTGGTLSAVWVTNTFSTNFTYISSSSTPQQGAVYTNSSSILLEIEDVPSLNVSQLTLTIEDTTPGFLTNTIVVADPYDYTNTVTTNLVTELTVPETDLAVGFIPPPEAVITNDSTFYGLIVSNLGPGAATGVILTNTVPSGIVVTSASLGYTASSSNLIFDVGTLNSGSNTVVEVYVQPTNAGVLPLSASVAAPGFTDSNPTNNTVSTNLTVMNYYASLLTVSTNSPQTTNFENGLTEQSIVISNAAATNVPAVRIVVTGLTKQLFNAVGTNNGSPFVYYSAPLGAGQSANLLLRYNPWGTFPFTNGQLHAFAVPLPQWTPPPATTASTNVNIQRIVKLPNGNILLEFPSTSGQTYTVIYSDNPSFSNAMVAPPAIVAPANETLWIDYGPPGTTNAPTAPGSRFYRVQTNP